jgi:hypothetical protein
MSETVTAQGERTGKKSADGSRGGSAARSVMSNHQNHAENGTFSAVAGQSQGEPSEFIPILPADIAAGQSPDSVFHFLGSKTDPILHVQYPRPWNHVAHFVAKRGEIPENSIWRRGRDSNPRYREGTHDFESCALNRTQPPLRGASGSGLTIGHGGRESQDTRTMRTGTTVCERPHEPVVSGRRSGSDVPRAVR